jgi:hypothetical protein
VVTIGITCFDTRKIYVAQIKHFYILFSSATASYDIANQPELFGVCNADLLCSLSGSKSIQTLLGN